MVTTQQIRVNNISPDSLPQKQNPLISEFTAQRILRLCNMFAMQHPKSRVIVIIQGSAYPKDIEVEENAPGAYSKEDGELDVLLSSLRQASNDGNSINYSSKTEPKAPENTSISLNCIESVGKEEHTERGDQPLLTNRETEILKHIACGETNKRIAYIVGISEQTVKCYVSSILRKLRANDRAHSVALALRYGFI